ncbi:uroporphyrinogen decarboxylase, partial [bacterium]|nr:uroporphyrinogen decarboxylase [bacterium]
GVDAIIVFNDILIPLQNMGFTVEYKEGGPVVEPPARCNDDLSRIQPARFDETPPVFDSLTEIRKRVGDEVPVLGFAGAPFTMAAYMSEGVTSKNLRYIKSLVFGQPDLLQRLLEMVTETVIDYLRIQIKAGVCAVQIFDTWAGALSKDDYRKFALPYQQQVIKTIQDEGTPVILYVKGSPHVIDELGESGAQVVSVDWLTPLSEAHKRLGASVALQGNLDPTALYAPPEAVASETQRILQSLDRTTGHIANLGHGILPETPVESVRAFVETVKAHEYHSA